MSFAMLDEDVFMLVDRVNVLPHMRDEETARYSLPMCQTLHHDNHSLARKLAVWYGGETLCKSNGNLVIIINTCACRH